MSSITRIPEVVSSTGGAHRRNSRVGVGARSTFRRAEIAGEVRVVHEVASNSRITLNAIRIDGNPDLRIAREALSAGEVTERKACSAISG